MNFQMSDMAYILPETILAVCAMLLLVADLLIHNKQVTAWLSLAIVGATMAFTMSVPAGTAFSGMVISDGYAAFFKMVFLINAALSILVSGAYFNARNEEHGEYYILMLFATLGMMLMASAGDLMSLYLGLELMALSTYVLAGFLRRDTKSNESSVKYFMLGAFSSAFLLYGVSLIYGLTGTTQLAGIAKMLGAKTIAGNPVLLAAIVMFIVAFGFKVAAAPFHMWAPDVYEGAPTPVTAFMSVGPKAAGFAVMARVFVAAFASELAGWSALLSVIAVLTMAVGNIMALGQSNIKRMLAYSSIAHAGYALIGVIAGTQQGVAAMMSYMMIYAFMNVGAFAVVILLDRSGRGFDSLEDFRGLSKTRPGVAFLMLLFMFSLTGIPPTAGFIGKFYLFTAAVNSGHVYIVVAAAVFSAVSAYFYLRVVRLMYMEAPAGEVMCACEPVRVKIVLALTAMAVVLIGLFPDALVSLARGSASVFRG
jgi:NADH-quinone oxidoreductase subunit N